MLIVNNFFSLNEELRQVRDEEKKWKNSNKQLKEETEIKIKDFGALQKQRDKLEKQLKDRRKEEDDEDRREEEERETQERQVDSLREEVDTLKLNLSSLETNVTSCLAQLASERADRLLVPPQGAGGGPPPRHLAPGDLGPGQLPDLNPDAVSVVRKETHGK